MMEANEENWDAQPPKILVLGVGNYLLGDEGVGVHAVRAFQEVCPPGVAAIEVGTAIWRIESMLPAARLLVVFDALQAGGAPGSIYATSLTGTTSQAIQISLHEYSLGDAVKTLLQQPDGLVLGIEPEGINYGCELSAPAAEAIPKAIQWALAIIRYWQAMGEEKSAESEELLEWLAAQSGVKRV
jgi:hydrogenase maturation protease